MNNELIALEKEHLDAIMEDGFEPKIAAKSSAAITINHMKGFAEWIDMMVDNSRLEKRMSGKWYADDKVFAQSTEELIQLYFNQINKQ